MKKLGVLALSGILLCSQPLVVLADNNETQQTAEEGSEETAWEVICISTAEDFLEFSQNCTLDTWSCNKQILLLEDISLKGVDYTPVPTFGGVFQGNGHTISGLEITDSISPAGLFGVIQTGGVVENLKVSGLVEPTGNAEVAGGIVGENFGTVQNCIFEGTVTGDKQVGGIVGINRSSGTVGSCSTKGSIQGENMTGGIAGCNLGVIEACRNEADVNVESVEVTLGIDDINIEMMLDMTQIRSMDTSTAASDTGGVAGYSSGLILLSENSAAVGYPHIGYNVGGIVGRSSGHLNSCTNTGEIFGRKEVGGIAGQLEPYVDMEMTEDTLSQLKGQLNDLNSMVDSAMDKGAAKSNAANERLKLISDYVDSAIANAENVQIGGNISTEILEGIGNGVSAGLEVTPPQMDITVDPSDITLPDVELPAPDLPEVTLPDAELPSFDSEALPDITLPDAELPDVELPDVNLPGLDDTFTLINGGVISIGEATLNGGLTKGSISGQLTPNLPDDLNIGTFSGVEDSLAGLTGAVNGMAGQIRGLNDDLLGNVSSAANDINAITNQIESIYDTLYSAELVPLDGERVTDTSQENIDEVTLGKAADCLNQGTVNGDINVGGITGAMAIEYELDPEDELSSNLSAALRQRYELKAIIQNCTNRGEIISKRSNVGGICGRMDMGLIIGAQNYGAVTSENGDYAGGIAGLAAGTVKESYAKAVLRGNSYVGGIIGAGVESESDDADGTVSSQISVSESEEQDGGTVIDCYAFVSIPEYEQYVGAVSGADIGTYQGNYFVSEDLAGINGISYTGRAEPMTYAEMQKLCMTSADPDEETETEGEAEADDDTPDQFLPAEFSQLTLRFVADGEVLKEGTFTYGKSFGDSIYPEIPEKEGYYAKWDMEELTGLCYDTVVTVNYYPYTTTLAGSQTRENGRPVFLVEGQFSEGDAVEETLKQNTVPDIETVEQWSISIPEDGQKSHVIRYLPGNEDVEKLSAYVRQSGEWYEAESRVIGSCLVFEMDSADTEIVIGRDTIWTTLKNLFH